MSFGVGVDLGEDVLGQGDVDADGARRFGGQRDEERDGVPVLPLDAPVEVEMIVEVG